jgi:hypothetical protein
MHVYNKLIISTNDQKRIKHYVWLESHIVLKCLFFLIKVFYSPTDAQVNCLKNDFKIVFKTIQLCISW